MKNIREQWEKFRYKKTLMFGCFLIFVFFYDFTKNSHGLSIENGTDQNITIMEIVNDDRKIVAIREILTRSETSREVGCSHALSVSAYGGSTLQVIVKNADNSVQTAMCKLTRPNGFLQRLYGDRYYSAHYDGSTQLNCKSFYVDSPICGIDDDSIGLHKSFKLK